MSHSPPAVTGAELAVLELLWIESPRTARQLTERLYPPGSPSDVSTVQKLLQRLEGKRLVTRDRSERTHAFSPVATREEYAGGRLAELAERLSDGSLAPLLLHLVSSRRLSAKQLAELRRVLDDAPKARKGRS
ncbi:MAG: BlaI/MecI/CopY family transcriptional regulator [Planctomycetaceae bacterium]